MNRLRDIRRQKGFTQLKLANLAGVSTTTINMAEQRLIRPTLETRQKIAGALEVNPEDVCW
jgi:transcriptional regulator with XRE-family HTH domain